LNIGGIANLTAIPAGASPEDVLAFDTGPGNMVIDALAEQLFGQTFDRDGRIAASGHVDQKILVPLLRRRFFCITPPKTAGREEFGREFAREFLQFFSSSRASAIRSESAKRDALATATSLTISSIRDAIARFVLPRGKFAEVVVSGGGTRNATLTAWLSTELRALKLDLRSSEEFGIASEAKEAVAFAVLAFETWHRRASNVPSATGAKRAAVLGKISCP
jgi:anhydro-N-acetylmuramic acid kinase